MSKNGMKISLDCPFNIDCSYLFRLINHGHGIKASMCLHHIFLGAAGGTVKTVPDSSQVHLKVRYQEQMHTAVDAVEIYSPKITFISQRGTNTQRVFHNTFCCFTAKSIQGSSKQKGKDLFLCFELTFL